jgi:hypothetical protein
MSKSRDPTAHKDFEIVIGLHSIHSLGTVSKDRQKGKNRIKRRRGGGKKWEGINDYTQ